MFFSDDWLRHPFLVFYKAIKKDPFCQLKAEQHHVLIFLSGSIYWSIIFIGIFLLPHEAKYLLKSLSWHDLFLLIVDLCNQNKNLKDAIVVKWRMLSMDGYVKTLVSEPGKPLITSIRKRDSLYSGISIQWVKIAKHVLPVFCRQIIQISLSIHQADATIAKNGSADINLSILKRKWNCLQIFYLNTEVKPDPMIVL